MPLFNQGGYRSGRYGLSDSGPIYSQPLSYYLNLFTSEYRMTPNLNRWANRLLTPLDDITNCISSMSEAFDLDSAVGVQLDVLGVIIGQSRTVGFQPSDGVSPVLDDATYRLLLQARIAFNQWDGLQASLQSTWQTLFPGGKIVIVDAQNMSAAVVMSGVFTSIIQDLITNGYIVPRPEAVEFSYSFATLPIFGFDENSSFIAGFDVGHMA